MINDYYELDGDGIWLPEGWRKMDGYIRKDGKYIPRNGIYGCKWQGSQGNVEIVKEVRVSITLSQDRELLALFEYSSTPILLVFRENGQLFGSLNIPPPEKTPRESPTFYAIEIPSEHSQWQIKFNDGYEDYIADLNSNFELDNIREFRW
ncbi:hypothetical protein C0J08_15840 [Marinomonas sp. CT5]|uniref:hypothetical protein n=1 Tax=Marinomonas sp. CT5 TaxID=2066133 RepID=UPI001BAE88D6|nr:hypothetical protein [Marinomonas sp. CT5]QUX96776.1 hypothetical protein C0J08_15840 [Marinomonas sp. CT5]